MNGPRRERGEFEVRGAAFLELRIGAFFLGAVLGLAGIFLDRSWLVTAALVVLLVGVTLRVRRGRDPPEVDQEPRTPTQ